MTRQENFKRLIRNKEEIKIGDNLVFKNTKGFGFVVVEDGKPYYNVQLTAKEFVEMIYLLLEFTGEMTC